METIEFIADILSRFPEAAALTISRQGPNAKATPTAAVDLAAVAAEFNLKVIETDNFIAVAQYDLASDTQHFRVQRKFKF